MKIYGYDLSKLVRKDDKENSKQGILALCCTIACIVMAIFFIGRFIYYFVN